MSLPKPKSNNFQIITQGKLLKILIICFLCTILFLCETENTFAVTFTVSKIADTNDGICDADCSLREAIDAANNSATDDIIEFNPAIFGSPQTITLDENIPAGITVADNGTLTINGTGATMLTISGGNLVRIFVISPNATATLNNMTISDADSFFGAVLNSGGFLTINDSVISNNSGNQGGGIRNENNGNIPTLTLNNSTVSGNTAATQGAGIDNVAGTTTINNSIITGNTSDGSGGTAKGGGIFNQSGATLNITNSTISGNTTIGVGLDAGGGGIHNLGTITINKSTISGNSAGGPGGGIYHNLFSTTDLTNTTISGNTSTGDNGGGISIRVGTMNLSHTTISNNNSANDGGGVFNLQATVNSRNSLIANNTDTSATANDFSGTITSQGYNLVEDTTGTTINGTTTGNVTGVDPNLGVLQNNGGPTETHELLSGSAAIDAGDPVMFEPVDQRDVTRPIDGDGSGTAQPDIGAFESNSIDCSYTLSSSSTSVGAAGSTGTVDVTSNAGCTWTAVSNDSWITVTSGSSGGGNGTVSFTVAANTGEARSGTITIAGNTFTVNQASDCSFDISPSNQDFTAAGGTGSFVLTASNSSCSWTATASDNWIMITSSTTGSGSSTINFSVAANSGSPRSGTIMVGGQTFTVNQAGGCTYSINPTSTSASASGVSGTVAVTSGEGCAWTAVSNDSWITLTGNSSGSGFGLIPYFASPNSGPARSGTITIAGETLTINQLSGCSYFLSPGFENLPSGGGNGSFGMITGNGCVWTATTSDLWITLTNASGTGNGTISYTVTANTGEFRRGTITVNYPNSNFPPQTFLVGQQGSIRPRGTVFDFDGDGKTDISIFRPFGGQWWYRRSSDLGSQAVLFGNSTDIPVPADFTGDGKTDIAFFRPSSAEWFILRSEDNSFFSFPFGTNGDIPAPGDFDGDGMADPIVYRPSAGTWFIAKTTGGTLIVPFGIAEDKPVVADYDGDGKDDVAIYRPSLGEWFILRSQDGLVVLRFGSEDAIAVPGDYSGDGKADIAIYEPTGRWFIFL